MYLEEDELESLLLPAPFNSGRQQVAQRVSVFLLFECLAYNTSCYCCPACVPGNTVQLKTGSTSVMENLLDPPAKPNSTCSASPMGLAFGLSQAAQANSCQMAFGRHGDAPWPTPDCIRREINVTLYRLVIEFLASPSYR